MPYKIEVRPAAAGQLRKLDPPTARRIQGVTVLLADEPRPPASRPLTGRPARRVRVGDHRVIYTIENDRLVVVVVVVVVVVITIGHRRDVYR